MLQNDWIRWREYLRPTKTKEVFKAIAKKGGVASFSEIRDLTGLDGSVLVHHLDRLISSGLLRRVIKGAYELTYKGIMTYLCGGTANFAYIGLLGIKREEDQEAEPKVAIELLSKEGISPKICYICTSRQGVESWPEGTGIEVPFAWILVEGEEIIDVDAVKEKVRPYLESLLPEHAIVLDCTSATKPATIAYYELAQEYPVLLIYVYEASRKLKWLISKEDIARKLGLLE